MALDLKDYETHARDAVRTFWRNREAARAKKAREGKKDTGDRGSATAGKNMDGFIEFASKLIKANGLGSAQIMENKGVLTLPGYYRPTKLWDMLVVHEGQLVALLEFKSQASSFGKNYNNRIEEAIGSAQDLWTAHREGAFGDGATRPFLGWIMLIADSEEANKPRKTTDPHYPVDPEFADASYAKRYDVFCKRLVLEGLYTKAALLSSPSEAITDGRYRHLSESTSLKPFVAQLAGHIAAAATR